MVVGDNQTISFYNSHIVPLVYIRVIKPLYLQQISIRCGGYVYIRVIKPLYLKQIGIRCGGYVAKSS